MIQCCESTKIHGYQFSLIKEGTEVHGFLNSWIGVFQYTHPWKSPFCWEPTFVVWPTHEKP